MATRTKIMIQVLSPAADRAWVWENPASRKRRPKKTAMNQNSKCSTPIQTMELVDCEKSQATGAKPTSKRVMSMSKPDRRPTISARRA